MAPKPPQNTVATATASHADTRATNAKKQKQQIAVIVLLAALLGVVMTQGKKKDDAPEKLAAVITKVNVGEENTVPQVNEDLQTLLRTSDLGIRNSDEIAARNPFVGRVRRQEISAAPPRVTAVYQSKRSTAAIVGKRIVQSGETLSDGHKVVGVSRSGIRVEP